MHSSNPISRLREKLKLFRMPCSRKTDDYPRLERLESRVLLFGTDAFPIGLPLQRIRIDADHDGIDDRLEQSLAETYAPVIFMEPDESNYPVNVDWILRQNQLWYSEQGLTPDQSKSIGGLVNTQDNLLRDVDGSGNSWIHPGSFGSNEPLSLDGFFTTGNGDSAKPLSTTEPLPDGIDGQHFGDDQLWYLGDGNGNDKAGIYRQGSLNPKDWVTYVHAYPTDDGGVMIQYWHTFSFNQFAAFDAHGGDWDASIQVQLDSRLQLKGVWYSRHNDDHPGTFMAGTLTNTPNFSLYQGTHPYVTIDGGGHGAFASPSDWASDHHTTAIQTGTISWTNNPDDPASLRNVNATNAGANAGYSLDAPSGGTIWKTWDVGDGTEVRQSSGTTLSLISRSSGHGGLINVGEYNPGEAQDNSVQQASHLLEGEFHPLNGQDFIKYSGRWGTTNNGASDGPRGPVFQGFTAPFGTTGTNYRRYTAWLNQGADAPASPATAPWIVPPATRLTVGNSIIRIRGPQLINSATAISLSATANTAATLAGVTQTYYRIYPSSASAPGFSSYSSSFSAVGLSGNYQIDCFSIDALGNQEAAQSRIVSLYNPAVAATGGFAISATRGVPIIDQTVATFVDPGGAELGGTAPGYQATIDWGDGANTTTGTVTFLGTQGSTTQAFTVSGTHIYSANGNYPVTVTIAHSGNNSMASSKAAVQAVRNQVRGYGPGNALVIGGTLTGSTINVISQDAQTVQVSIDGIDQGTFTGFNTIDIYGQDGNDDIELPGVNKDARMFGGGGNDVLVGGNGNDLLVGGNGNDVLTAGTGRDILIGGFGRDNINGGSGGDILIGDGTTFDAATPENERAMFAILNEWKSVDTYATRFRSINSGTGSGAILGTKADLGGARLNFGTTVRNDVAFDILTAVARIAPEDWFFQGAGDTLVNVQPGEHINNNTPAAFANRAVTSTINEGDTATVSGTITEPDRRDNFKLKVNWGDGTQPHTYSFPAGSNGRRVSVSHRYRKPGAYMANLFWHDPLGPGNTANLAVNVLNVPPVLHAGNTITTRHGDPFVRRLSFDDPGPGPWTAIVDYGDDSGVQTLHLKDRHFTLRHKYNAAATYHVIVRLTDANGGEDSVAFDQQIK